MHLGALLLVSLALGLSNFAAAIGIGLSGVDARTRLTTALAFGFFEAAMPIIGLLLGQSAAARIGHVGRYVGAGLLVLTGLYAFWQARQDQKPLAGRSPSAGQTSTPRFAITAFALSIDNLVVGFALSFARMPLVLAATIIASVSVLMSLVGLELGQRLGERIGQWSEEIGAGVLILVGIAIGSGKLG